MPSMIINDNQSQFASSYNYAVNSIDVSSSGNWHKKNDITATETIKVGISHIVSDRWQIGIALPVQRKTKDKISSSGISDISANIGYEALTIWEYSPWKPKGILFMQAVFPTGRSTYEANEPYQMDTRGKGFLSIGAGAILTKNISDFDLSSTAEIHKSLPSTKNIGGISARLNPGYGGTISIGSGYNFKAIRIGAELAWAYEEGIDISALQSSGKFQRHTTFTTTGTYSLPNDWLLSLSLSDQTLFGSPMNTALSKSAMLSIQKGWPR